MSYQLESGVKKIRNNRCVSKRIFTVGSLSLNMFVISEM